MMTNRKKACLLAAHAICDPRTARKYLADPASLRGAVRERLDAAARELGMAPEPCPDTARSGDR